MQIFSHDDPGLEAIFGDAHSRLEAMRREAEPAAREFYRERLDRDCGIEELIAAIFAEVEDQGAVAVRRWAAALDRVVPDLEPIPAAACAAAWEAADPELRAALELAIKRVEAYQRRLLPIGFGADLDEELGALWIPLRRVGAYVPGGSGGSVPLVSTVVMNLVPARVAGVDELVMVTPPRPDGSICPDLLAAAHAVGVDAVYALGGIPAIAALACGCAELPAVDKLVGPGNLFVTLAKRQAYGRVDVDMLAGPSEVLVISDGGTDPEWIAADLLSQAEHDPLAMCILVTVAAPEHNAAVRAACARQAAALPDARREAAEASLSAHGLAIDCPDLAAAVALADRCAPEHLELLVAEPAPALAALHHAGAVFVGPWSPEPIGDYVAGPSHTLPTGGSARMWAGIGADTFLRRMSVINLDAERFAELAPAAVTLAEREGLAGHARSLTVRGIRP